VHRLWPPRLATLAYLVAALFVVRWVGSFLLPANPPLALRDGTLGGALLGVAPHLLLFPIVAALAAPSWGRAAGWGWLVIDMTSAILALNGVPQAIYLPLRYGGHVSAALWIAAAHRRAQPGASRPAG
jgi:hypothetical protein